MSNNRSANQLSRRQFVKSAAVVATAASAFPRFVVGAENNQPLKIGLIGCGGRGTGAAMDAMNADPNVQVIALADLMQDRLDGCRKALAEQKQVKIEDQNCFVGLNAFKSVMELPVDYVILATPPYYRPEHFAAAIEAGKHVFMEKPVAVDPVGARKMMEVGKKADVKNLSVVAGTQRRHQKNYIETIKRIKDGEIGKVVAAQVYWCNGQLWYRKREPNWSDMEWMHRDWVNWTWLSGDHIIEQHVHNIDVANWVIGTHPVSAVGFGGRARRVTGDQYDYFSVDFTYPDEVHVHSMCRQINGTTNNVSERIVGTKGWSNAAGFISTVGDLKIDVPNPYVQEHADLIAAIRTGKRINETQNVAESTLSGIMGRIAAYTGTEVKWDDIMKSELSLKSPDYVLSEENIKAHVPVPGTV